MMQKYYRKTSEKTQEQINKLIPALKAQEMNAKQIIQYLNIQGDYPYKVVLKLIIRIGDMAPLFEPIPGHFKILTTKDFEQYEQMYLIQKGEKHYVKRF